MSISPEAITEFQSLYEQGYGVVLSVEEAHLKARQLTELFKILAAAPPFTEETALKAGFPTLHNIENR